MEKPIATTVSINKLIALWAFCESGLGGLLFALHIPLTGFLVGAFAVIIITLIAFYSQHIFRQILQATVLVILVKAAASPHSPPPAYIAVAFQGFVGAIIFSLIRKRIIACILLGVLSMAESALQKLLLLTIIFGKSLWEALNGLYETATIFFHVKTNTNFSLWLIVSYVSLYVAWGIIVGVWAAQLPRQLEQEEMPEKNLHLKLFVDRKKRNYSKLLSLSILLLITIGCLLFQQNISKTVYVLCRTILVTAILYLIALPLITRLMQKWFKKATAQHSVAIENILNELPEIKMQVKIAWAIAGENFKGTKKVRKFILYLLLFTLKNNEDEQQ